MIDRGDEADGARRAQRRPQSEIGEHPAARRGVAERRDLAHAIALDHEDPGRDGSPLEDGVEGDRPRIVERDPLGQLGEDPADRGVVPGAEHHPDLAVLADEEAAGDGRTLHDGGECHDALGVDDGRTEAGEHTARRGCVSLRDDLPEPAGRRHVDRLQALPASTNRGEECDVAAVVERWRVEDARTPDGTPGAAPPVTATVFTVRPVARKMPSTVLPPATAAAKASLPCALSAGIGCLPKPEKVPPAREGSPSTTTWATFASDPTKTPSLPRPRSRVAT